MKRTMAFKKTQAVAKRLPQFAQFLEGVEHLSWVRVPQRRIHVEQTEISPASNCERRYVRESYAHWKNACCTINWNTIEKTAPFLIWSAAGTGERNNGWHSGCLPPKTAGIGQGRNWVFHSLSFCLGVWKLWAPVASLQISQITAGYEIILSHICSPCEACASIKLKDACIKMLRRRCLDILNGVFITFTQDEPLTSTHGLFMFLYDSTLTMASLQPGAPSFDKAKLFLCWSWVTRCNIGTKARR